MNVFLKVVAILLSFLMFPLKADLTVEQAWSRASPPAAQAGAVYGQLKNSGPEAVTIIGVEYAGAARSEIHHLIEEDGMMKMRSAMPLILAPGESLSLAPGGTHIMLMGLSDPLRQGARLEFQLVTTGGSVPVTAQVGAIGQMSPPHQTHHHH